MLRMIDPCIEIKNKLFDLVSGIRMFGEKYLKHNNNYRKFVYFVHKKISIANWIDLFNVLNCKETSIQVSRNPSYITIPVPQDIQLFLGL